MERRPSCPLSESVLAYKQQSVGWESKDMNEANRFEPLQVYVIGNCGCGSPDEWTGKRVKLIARMGTLGGGEWGCSYDLAGGLESDIDIYFTESRLSRSKLERSV